MHDGGQQTGQRDHDCSDFGDLDGQSGIGGRVLLYPFVAYEDSDCRNAIRS